MPKFLDKINSWKSKLEEMEKEKKVKQNENLELDIELAKKKAELSQQKARIRKFEMKSRPPKTQSFNSNNDFMDLIIGGDNVKKKGSKKKSPSKKKE